VRGERGEGGRREGGKEGRREGGRGRNYKIYPLRRAAKLFFNFEIATISYREAERRGEEERGEGEGKEISYLYPAKLIFHFYIAAISYYE
jgi:hypothetical protein